MKKKILITGWTGYIGSHAVVAFEEAGYETVILDNLSNSSDETLENIWNILWYIPEFYKCDLRNIDEIKNIFEEHVFDWVIHFAGAKAVWESCEDPIYYFQNNISGSINLFEVMKDFWVKNIIFSSSATVYDSENTAPLSEKNKLWTVNPYGTSKLLLEKILEDLARFAQFQVISLRYFNPIWAHPSGKIWENPEWVPNNLLPYIMKVATWELTKLNVYWDDYDTLDGTWVRDYIDVNDLVEGHLLAYKKLEKNQWVSFCDVYNLWVGKWASVLEMIKESEDITWKKINYSFVDRRTGDLWEVYCCPDRAKNELWFDAKVSLKESLKNSWKFYKK
jgi:UDP-glucose 4-epimerase